MGAARPAKLAPPSRVDRPHIYAGERVKTLMGRPPKVNDTLLGAVITQRSVAYKGVVKALDEYRDVIGGSDKRAVVASIPAARARQIEDLDGILQKAQEDCQNYIGQHAKEPSKREQCEVMRRLGGVIQRERGLLAYLGRNAADLPEGARFDRLLAMRHAGIPPYADVDTYGQANETGRKALGSGACNDVYKVEYANGETKAYKRAFSQANREEKAQAAKLGIDVDDPRYAPRNVAASKIDRALKAGLIPRTDFASHGEEYGIVMDMAKGKPPGGMSEKACPLLESQKDYIQMLDKQLQDNVINERAFTKSIDRNLFIDVSTGDWMYRPNHMHAIDLANPELIHQLSNLEWLDMVCGQSDRHTGNYLIDVEDDGRVTLTGIDNDFCFGAKNDSIDKPVEEQVGRPLLIDRGMMDNLLELRNNWHEPGGMASQLQEVMLSRAEIQAAESRLDQLVDHVGELEKEGYVVDDWAEWREPSTGRTAAELLGEAGPNRSYWAKLDDEARTYAPR